MKSDQSSKSHNVFTRNTENSRTCSTNSVKKKKDNYETIRNLNTDWLYDDIK